MKKQRLKGKHKTRTIISVTAAVILLLPKGYLVKGETYEYDALNRIQKVYYDDGSVAEYFYDASGNIQNVRIVSMTVLKCKKKAFKFCRFLDVL